MLRTRSVSGEVAKLLSVANQLPRKLDGNHDSVLNSRVLKIDEAGTRYFLERANERLPAELQVFVRPDHSHLANDAEGWEKAIGPLLFDCALAASGGLLLPSPPSASELKSRQALERGGQIRFPHEGKPFFGIGEVEAMRQRYLFLFALREILKATSQAHVSLSEARRLLDLQQNSFSAVAQSRAFRGQFDISTRMYKNKTHKLGFAKPQVVWLLEEIEAERIRECPVCGRLFWAGRLDQSACRPKCSNVLRARTWREKYGHRNKPRKRKAADASESKTKTKKEKKGT